MCASPLSCEFSWGIIASLPEGRLGLAALVEVTLLLGGFKHFGRSFSPNLGDDDPL